MDELLLSKRKRLMRDSIYFAFGGVALIFFVIYFCLLILAVPNDVLPSLGVCVSLRGKEKHLRVLIKL